MPLLTLSPRQIARFSAKWHDRLSESHDMKVTLLAGCVGGRLTELSQRVHDRSLTAARWITKFRAAQDDVRSERCTMQMQTYSTRLMPDLAYGQLAHLVDRTVRIAWESLCDTVALEKEITLLTRLLQSPNMSRHPTYHLVHNTFRAAAHLFGPCTYAYNYITTIPQSPIRRQLRESLPHGSIVFPKMGDSRELADGSFGRRRLGPFAVCLDWNRRTPELYVLPRPSTTQFSAYFSEDSGEHSYYWHPHVHTEGGPCWGTAQNPLKTLLEIGDLTAALCTVNSLLGEYNSNSPIRTLKSFRPWPKRLRCAACAVTNPATLLVPTIPCVYCKRHYCSAHCSRGCKCCGTNICESCRKEGATLACTVCGNGFVLYPLLGTNPRSIPTPIPVPDDNPVQEITRD